MKAFALSLVIALSLAANAALILKLRRPITGSDAEAALSTSAAGKTAATRPSDGGIAPGSTATGSMDSSSPSTATAPKFAGVDWSFLHSGDLREVVAKLRAAGLPASTIRAIVSAKVREQFAERRKALYPLEEAAAFWTDRNSFRSDPATMAARRELTREQSRLLKELLGSDAETSTDPFMEAYNRNRYGNLPKETIDQLQQITQDYSDLSMQVRTEARGLMLAEDRETLAFLEAEKRRDLEQILTPEQLEEYMMRSSPTASQLRSQLASFDPTEQEFRALYKLQEAFDAKYSFSTGTALRTPETTQQRRADEQAMIAEAKALLGEERGAEYERLRDYSYRNLAAIAQRLNLPKETAAQVWSYKTEVEQRAREIRANQNLQPAERTQQLAALQQEATTKLKTTLGERGTEAYKQNGAFWLQNLNPQSRSTPTQTTSGMIFMPGG